MLGQASLPNDNLPSHLRAEAYQAFKQAHSGKILRVLWTGFGFAVFMLIGLSARAHLPLALHAPAKPSHLAPEVAFNPLLPGLHPGSSQARLTALRPALTASTPHSRPTALRPAVLRHGSTQMMENNRYQSAGVGELQLQGPNMRVDTFVPDAALPRSPIAIIGKVPAMASQKNVSSDLPFGMGILGICGAVGALLYTIATKVGWRLDTPGPALQLAGAAAGTMPGGGPRVSGIQGCAPGTALQFAGAGVGATPVVCVTPSRSGALLMCAENGDGASAPTNSRWKDDILNDSLPDPVFDRPSGYKGSVPYGFSTTAENWNGKAAMMGFTILYVQELILGKGVLELFGLLDPGANPPS